MAETDEKTLALWQLLLLLLTCLLPSKYADHEVLGLAFETDDEGEVTAFVELEDPEDEEVIRLPLRALLRDGIKFGDSVEGTIRTAADALGEVVGTDGHIVGTDLPKPTETD